jgi:hypothetical protein
MMAAGSFACGPEGGLAADAIVVAAVAAEVIAGMAAKKGMVFLLKGKSLSLRLE